MVVILLATRGLGVYLPPELFESQARASIEAKHLAHRLGEPDLTLPGSLPATVPAGTRTLLHLMNLRLPESWRESPLWIGLERSSEEELPSVTPILGDDPEALAWFSSRVGTIGGSRLTSSFYEATVTRNEQDSYVGILHVKRVGNL